MFAFFHLFREPDVKHKCYQHTVLQNVKKKVQQGYASLLVLLADGAIVFARGTTLCSWWNHSSYGACSCFLPRKMVWCASWSPTTFYNKIQVNGLPRNATSVTLGKESRNSQVQSLGSGGNREMGKVSKKTSLILFSTIVTVFQIAQCKKLLEHPLKYT